MGKNRGLIWDHFGSIYIGDLEYGRCNHCKKDLKVKDSNTSGLRRHLLKRHPTIWIEFVKLDSKEKRENIQALKEMQNTLSSDEEFDEREGLQTFEVLNRTIKKPRLTAKADESRVRSHVKVKKNSRQQLRMDYNWARFFVMLNLPLSLMENENFKEHWNIIMPNYHLKSRRTFVHKVNLFHYNVKSAVDAMIEKDFQDVQGCGLTSDIWTSRANEAYQVMF